MSATDPKTETVKKDADPTEEQKQKLKQKRALRARQGRLKFLRVPSWKVKPRQRTHEQLQQHLWKQHELAISKASRTDPETGKVRAIKRARSNIKIPKSRKRRNRPPLVVTKDGKPRRYYKYGQRGYRDTARFRLADNVPFLPWWKQQVDKKASEVEWCTTGISRPLVTVQKAESRPHREKKRMTYMAPVFLSPLRPDIVRWVFAQQNKNRRQPYAVYAGAGHQHSAESWGTGRAVSRIPRVSGGGTSRAGQGAFGNMCRSGRMFSPTKTWRKWHAATNLNMRRFAAVSAIAASSVPSLVEARGHHIHNVPELPLVVDNRIEKFQTTKAAVTLLKKIGAYDDVEKVKASRVIRAGKGKMRNRRYVQSVGPLVVYKKNDGIVQAFRNLPGVDLVRVEKLDVIKLAPGGTLGRFIVWSEAAFNHLEALWGSWTDPPKLKRKFRLPRPVMTNPDVTRILGDPAIQSKVRPRMAAPKKRRRKTNPLKNFATMVKLNPYALTIRRNALRAEIQRKKGRAPINHEQIKKKKEWAWRKEYNYKRIATTSNIMITYKEHRLRKTRGQRLSAIRKAKQAKIQEHKDKRKKFHKKIERLRRRAKKKFPKNSKEGKTKYRAEMDRIDALVERHHRPTYQQAREDRGPKMLSEEQLARRRQYLFKYMQRRGYKPKRSKLYSAASKPVSGANVSKTAEEAKPFKTYDNDMCMGKEAPVEAICKANFIQGKAPKKGDNIVVLLWRKSYKNGYKYMPLYSALADEFKDKPLSVVGCCLDRDKNAAAGFLKKYHNGPKGNFTTTFPICEEWAPPNKVKPLSGRPIEAGFLENMMDLHPGMKEIPSIPHMFLVNSSGTIVWHQDHSERGATAPDHMDEVKEQVSRLLSGKVLLSLGTKVVAGSSSEDESSDDGDGDQAAGDMGDFFTGL